MKKLYRKGTVHPSPPQIKSDDHLLPLLPVAIFSLAAVLSPEDREVLAYLISTASYSGDRNPTSRLNKTKAHKKTHFDNHSPLFHCDCFSCYTSYWVRWDSSPSRQLIHEIIDAFEDSLEKKKKKNVTGKKDRRKRSGKSSSILASSSFSTDESEIPSRLGESVVNSCPCSSSSELAQDGGGCNGGLEPTDDFCARDACEEAEDEKGTVRRFLSFIGEKVLGVWG
ncbi:unnamed protein product [Arabidopsis lyrata]|uniref:Uncharacterized protein n=1 Tax=Arabidopsis lyrata subsp. lyrata TaxID=81972 RepID=D7KN83_ARALL|nr:uncharacterized protein LOC9325974 [Arabidopsis lyrata subsp. lyrata]EFH68929.1 hypothetical protein ARALYDRAFT_471351 [Arabidopsis lyrata subsp. lyrata]CAH8252006.1 unnamed protein product [Arabidopsis lyrata]|eukprot:XP_020870639.1 uncharacterized protein LOC9325974 [Arabidopsis lyrata subsp. lyrata]